MIRELRESLAADLEALSDIGKVHASWPDRVSPPCLIVGTPDASYVDKQGATLGTYRVALDVVVLIPRAGSTSAHDRLDHAIEGVLHFTEDYQLLGVDGPGLVSVNGVESLGSTIHLAKLVINNFE